MSNQPLSTPIPETLPTPEILEQTAIPLAWLGDLLISLRNERGLSQRQLAERLGIHQEVIARWETSKYATASLERLRKVAEALEADIGVMRNASKSLSQE